MDVSDKETLLELYRNFDRVPENDGFIVNGIGFTGQKGSGKDTAADMLTEIIGSKEMSDIYRDTVWQRFAFATALKRMCSDGLGIPKEDLNTQDGKLKFNRMFNITNRKILQCIGDGLRSAMGEDVWVKIVENDIVNFRKLFIDGFVPKGMFDGKFSVNGGMILPKYPFFVVTDIRYGNEAEMVKGLNGIVVRVVRDATDVKTPEHKSEIPLDGKYVDETILNNGSLDDLRKSVMEILKRHVISGQGMHDWNLKGN